MGVEQPRRAMHVRYHTPRVDRLGGLSEPGGVARVAALSA